MGIPALLANPSLLLGALRENWDRGLVSYGFAIPDASSQLWISDHCFTLHLHLQCLAEGAGLEVATMVVECDEKSASWASTLTHCSSEMVMFFKLL